MRHRGGLVIFWGCFTAFGIGCLKSVKSQDSRGILKGNGYTSPKLAHCNYNYSYSNIPPFVAIDVDGFPYMCKFQVGQMR